MLSLPKLKTVFSPKVSALLNIVLPRFSDPAYADVWNQVTFIDEPCCFICGYPFEYDAGHGTVCAACIANPPKFDHCRSAMIYNENSRSAILAFKHGGRTMHLDSFARQLWRAGRQFWDEADFLMPVPLHRKRLIKRKYNQATLLGNALGKYVDVEFEADLLFRHKNTPSQGAQTAKGRYRNVRGAFTVPDNMKSKIKDKTIVIIDDVYTTGATLESCAATLKRAGAAKVFTLTLARVVREQEIPT